MSIIPDTYRALVVPKNAPMEFQIRSTAKPNEGQILIRVKYASINPVDYLLTKDNIFGLPEPLALGFEWSGVVAATGSTYSKFTKGQSVFGFAAGGQGFAEYLVVGENAAYVSPEFVDLRVASTVGAAYVTAYESMFVIDNFEKRKGQYFFVQGIGGGVGFPAAVIAKKRGLIVIGTASNPGAIEYLKTTFKFDHIINYKEKNVTHEVMKITNGRGSDIVYDPTYSTKSMTESAGLVAKGGVWLRLGPFNHRESDEEARKIVNERGAKSTFGHAGRYWTDDEYKSKMPQLWIKTCEDFISQCKAGEFNIVINEVKFDPIEVQNALNKFAGGSGRFGRSD